MEPFTSAQAAAAHRLATAAMMYQHWHEMVFKQHPATDSQTLNEILKNFRLWVNLLRISQTETGIVLVPTSALTDVLSRATAKISGTTSNPPFTREDHL